MKTKFKPNIARGPGGRVSKSKGEGSSTTTAAAVTRKEGMAEEQSSQKESGSGRAGTAADQDDYSPPSISVAGENGVSSPPCESIATPTATPSGQGEEEQVPMVSTDASPPSAHQVPLTTSPPVEESRVEAHTTQDDTLREEGATNLTPPRQTAVSRKERRSRSRTGSGSPDISEGIDTECRQGSKLKRKRNTRRTPPNPGTGDASEVTSPMSSKRQRSSAPRVREAPNRSTMTMQELIYYNPTANPMSSTLVERKKQKDDSCPASKGNTPVPAEGLEAEGREERAGPDEGLRGDEEGEEGGEESEGRLVPQLRIGADGNIIIDETSMVVETTHQQQLPGHISEVIEGGTSSHTTSASYRRRPKVTKWTRDETGKFFKALGQVGTDFTMMTLLLPSRSRKELKNKFKKEEKNSPHLISQALKNQQSRTQRT